MRCRTFLAILSVALLPMGAGLAKTKTPVVGAANDPQTATATPAPDTQTITYLGVTYALIPGCLATGFIVSITQTPVGQTNLVLIAVPYAGGVTALPPVPKAATGKLATVGLNDAVCLDVTDAP